MSNIKHEFGARINPVSINIETLEYLNQLVAENNITSVLEFGSGVSTEFWSEKVPSAKIISFDNSRRYTKITRSRLNQNATDATVRFAPLRRMKIFNTHYIGCKFLPYLRKHAPTKPFDIVLIDGPPGYLYAREATLLQAYPYLDENTLIIVDDAERDVERNTIKRWAEMFEMSELKFHEMGAKQIATFKIKPSPVKHAMTKSPVHTRMNMVKLLLTFYKRNTMHNLWLLKMRLLNREPFPDQKMNQESK